MSDWRAKTFSRRYSLLSFYSRCLYLVAKSTHTTLSSSARTSVNPPFRRDMELLSFRNVTLRQRKRDSMTREINGVNGNARNRVYEKKRKRFIYREYEVLLHCRRNMIRFSSARCISFDSPRESSRRSICFPFRIHPSRTGMYLVLRFLDSWSSKRKLPD